mmetsp:Transcript_53011/g.94612  ORF Transcript_53011/g.94612 Transcript_53011/m.94612 type:complete len:98 (-) Transcript_53011:1369-1662(-)
MRMQVCSRGGSFEAWILNCSRLQSGYSPTATGSVVHYTRTTQRALGLCSRASPLQNQSESYFLGEGRGATVGSTSQGQGSGTTLTLTKRSGVEGPYH